MSTADIRQKLHDYIETAPDKKIEAIYTMVEEEIEETYDWEDEEFVAQLLEEEKEYLNSTARTCSLGEVDEMTKETIKNVRANKSREISKTKA